MQIVTTKASTKVAAVATALAMASSMLSFAPAVHAQTCSVGTVDLTIGSTGDAVVCLQTALVAGGHLVMPAGVSMGYFGPLTQAAVAKWQAANGVAPAVGYFGPISRAAFSPVAGGTGTSTVPGCMPGYAFSPTTGQSCSAGSTVPGCMAGDVFSRTTGAACGSSTGGDSTGALEGGAGSVDSYTLVSSLNNEEVGEDEEDVDVAGIEIDVSEDSDIEITAVKLVFAQGTADQDFEDYADEVSIWLDGKEVARVDADRFDDDNSYTRTVSLKGAVIRADKVGDLVIAVSGAKTIDSGDQTETWTVDVTQVRFVDASGSTISEDPSTAARTFSFESFATATNAELNILEDVSDTNDARTIEVDATADTDNVEVLSFKFKNKGDSDVEIKNYAVSVTVTGATNTDDVLSSLSLWIDGEEVATADTVSSGGLTEDYLFDDVDYTIEAGETVSAVIKADFLSIADALDEGDTISFAINEDIDHITTRIKVRDEAGENLADSDLTGSVSSGAFELRSVGLKVTLVSVSEELSQDSDTADSDQGTFKIKVNVESFGGTVYVASSSQATTATSIDGDSILENLFHVDESGTATTDDLSDALTYTTSGGAALSSSVGNITLTEGEDTDITLTVVRTNDGDTDDDGLYRVLLKAIGWSATDAWGSYNIYDFNLEDFKTDFVSLN